MVCGGDIDFEILLLHVFWLDADERLCKRIDCFVSQGGLYSFCSMFASILLLSIVVLGQRLRSLADLFDLIELLNSSPRLNAVVLDVSLSVDWLTTAFILLLRLLPFPDAQLAVVVVVVVVLDCC